ncbi:suppressor of fused homolog [Patella vulgata]|uniref:suppressor of fused homolog n=1 Tax=Patella vulgata TaxID=6465 RepID=UPI00218064A4|nr:suppressor of fused homolog [Patella vulgata]
MDGETAGENKSEEVEDYSQGSVEWSDEETDIFDHLGIEAIDGACRLVYPDQPNPLQFAAVQKFWLGGPDPLDYISMFCNEGDLSKNIPPHWHYVSYGFSDLHGDGRVHRPSERGEASGFGFELTFRLKREPDETTPPMWPSILLNKLANYVFQTGNVLHVGDHIPWNKALNDDPESHIQHMLIAEDPQLLDLDTQNGTLDFRQVVGVTDDEVKSAQKWKGTGVLSLLSNMEGVGPFFVTDTKRSKSVFDEDPNLSVMVAEGIEKDGSNLGHVTAVCSWSESADSSIVNTSAFLERLDISDVAENTPPVLPDFNDVVYKETPVPVNLNSVHLYFDAEAAELLPMVVRARLKKGRFFIFHNVDNLAIHLLPSTTQDVGEVFVTEKDPIKMQGTYLQIYCSTDFIEEMSKKFECLQVNEDSDKTKELVYPVEFSFSNPKVYITVSKNGIA